jgi:hypothetical protein
MGRPRKHPNPDDIFVAKDSGFLTLKDGEVIGFKRGVTRFSGSHAAVKEAPHLFERIDVHYGVEKATAAPGEKRGS